MDETKGRTRRTDGREERKADEIKRVLVLEIKCEKVKYMKKHVKTIYPSKKVVSRGL